MTELKHPHRRKNLLSGEWVLISPRRTKRPWQGRINPPEKEQRSSYDPQCYHCPGNLRAYGIQNPVYTETFLFSNDFPALLPEIKLSASDLSESYNKTTLKYQNLYLCVKIIVTLQFFS